MLRAGLRRLNVGSALSAEVFNREWPDHVGSGRERIIHLGSPEFGCAQFNIGTAAKANLTWPSANKPVAIPFRVFRGMTVFQLGWRNGSGTMTDSFDIGIYDTAFARKVAGGGTARSGASAIQWVDVTDTYLPVGKYYLVGCGNGTTASQATQVIATSAVFMAGLGVMDSGTNAYTLPDPLTNMVAAATFTGMPWMAIAARIPF